MSPIVSSSVSGSFPAILMFEASTTGRLRSEASGVSLPGGVRATQPRLVELRILTGHISGGILQSNIMLTESYFAVLKGHTLWEPTVWCGSGGKIKPRAADGWY